MMMCHAILIHPMWYIQRASPVASAQCRLCVYIVIVGMPTCRTASLVPRLVPHASKTKWTWVRGYRTAWSKI